MNFFWKPIIQPILFATNYKKIVEIGCSNGSNTFKILRYCQQNKGRLTCIDPKPLFNTNIVQKIFGKHFEIYQDISLHVLRKIRDYNSVLIDGDHNWYTVFNELKTIENNALMQNQLFPLVFIHDIGWPYGRRDMYYNPETIPKRYLKPYAKKGIQKGYDKLLGIGGLNYHLYNAIYEGGEQNGVLTAIEDFLKVSSFELVFRQIASQHGLGILYPMDDKINVLVENTIRSSGLK